MVFSKANIKHQTEKAFLISKTSGPFHEVRTVNGVTRVFKVYNIREGWVPKSRCVVKSNYIEVPEEFIPQEKEKLV